PQVRPSASPQRVAQDRFREVFRPDLLAPALLALPACMACPAEPVLIVDDDQTSCRFMADVLSAAGYRVEWTTDDDGAVERVHRSPYALVIADVTMPGVSGPEIIADLERVRPGSPALLVSAFADGPAQAEARRLGVPLLAKPFAAELLISTVR